jgi:hypothetical protein
VVDDAEREAQIRAVRELLGRVLAAGHHLRGCSAQEIDDLCAATGIRSADLSPAYEEFLAIAGRRAGPIAAGSTLAWPAPMTLSESALVMGWALGVGKQVEQLEPFVGFLGHQGHTILLLLHRPDGDRVASIDEGEPYLHLEQEPLTFIDWLRAEVDAALDREPVPGEVPRPFE